MFNYGLKQQQQQKWIVTHTHTHDPENDQRI